MSTLNLSDTPEKELKSARIRLFEQAEEVINLRASLEACEAGRARSQSESEALTEKVAALEARVRELQDNTEPRTRVLELERHLLLSENARKKAESDLVKLRVEFRASETERKALKALNPERIKKNLVKQKAAVTTLREQLDNVRKKGAADAKALKQSNDVLQEAFERLDLVFEESDCFYLTDDQRWGLRLTHFQYPEEVDAKGKKTIRIRCLDYKSGTSALATELDESGEMTRWSFEIGIPEAVSRIAALDMKELKETGTLSRLAQKRKTLVK